MRQQSSPRDWPAEELEELGSCPVCGQAGRMLLHEALEDRVFGIAPGRWRLWLCDSCGAAYLDPRPTRASIGQAYSGYVLPSPPPSAAAEMKLAKLRRGVWNGHLNQRFGYDFTPASRLAGSVLWLFPKRRWGAEMTVRHLPRTGPAPRLLDVGFGRGEFLRTMSEYGWQVQGLEPDPEAVDEARAQGLDVEQGLIDDAPYPSESFDAITLSHVIEHLHDPVGSLAVCNRLLKAGGVLWVSTPNVASRAHRRFGRDWFGLDPPRHLVIFTRSSLELALRRASFDDVSFRRTYRGQMMVAASEAVAGGGDALSALTPVPRSSRVFGRALDVGAALRPEWGEELIVVARKAGPGYGTGGLRRTR